MTSLPLSSSVLACPFHSCNLSSPKAPSPWSWRGAPSCYPACILPPLAHPSPASILPCLVRRPALSPLLQRTRSPHPPGASLPARAGPGAGPSAGAGHAHHAVLPVPVGALGAPAGRAGAVHGAAAACFALLLHLLPRGRSARRRARVPEPGRPRLLRRREPGGRRAGSPRGWGAAAAAALQLGSHSPRVYRSLGSPTVPCRPRAGCPSLVSPVLHGSRDIPDIPRGT